MQMIIEAHLVDDEGRTERVELAAINRELTTDPLGMSLAEGKALLAAAQQYLVEWQCLLPDAGRQPKVALAVRMEISRFPCKERAHMPGSQTTLGCQSTCDRALCHIAFRRTNGVGTQNKRAIVARWLAYAYPCQRFALYLAVQRA